MMGFGLLLLASVPAADQMQIKLGHATSAADGSALYREVHLERYRDGRLQSRDVEYRCPTGELFALKRLELPEQGFVPRFELEDYRSGYREGVREMGQANEVFFQDPGAGERAASLARIEDLVADAGFDAFIVERFDELVTGKPLRFPFVVPARLDSYEFRLLKVPSIDTDPEGSIRLRLASGNALLRLFAPSMEVVYDLETRALLRYEGLSNVRDGSPRNRNYDVVIEFPPREQKVVDDLPEPGAGQRLSEGQSCPAMGTADPDDRS